MQTKETVTITKMFEKEQYSERTKKNYTKLAIKTNEFGDKWISGFKGKETAGWQVGSKVEIMLERKPDGKGGEYMNFSVPKVEEKMKFEMEGLLLKVGHMNYLLEQIAIKVGVPLTAQPTAPATIGNTGMEYPDEDINSEDIPF